SRCSPLHCFRCHYAAVYHALPSLPTRRSSDLISVRYANELLSAQDTSIMQLVLARRLARCRYALEDPDQAHRTVSEIAYGWGFGDRKSTRLNSSHVSISYAVFCLKKKIKRTTK